MQPYPFSHLHRLGAGSLVVLLAGCGSLSPSQPTEQPALVLVGSGPATERMDPAEILTAELQGDLLRLQLRYGGGCATHDFSLLHSGVFLESFPVQTHLTLAHDAHGDPCRALLSTRVEFDLTPLKRSFQKSYGERGTIVLHLRPPGATTISVPPIRYDF